jgi:hypothetical protein
MHFVLPITSFGGRLGLHEEPPSRAIMRHRPLMSPFLPDVLQSFFALAFPLPVSRYRGCART